MRDTARDLPRLLRPNGKPHKLRHLAYSWLGLTIQDGHGHDPCEDARAALLLYQRFERQFDEQVALRERARAKLAAQRATEGGGEEADDAAAGADAPTGCAAAAARGAPPAVTTATGPSRRRAGAAGKGRKSNSNKYRL